jgi:hypothetical protein
LEVAFESGAGTDVVEVNRLFYQFPLGSSFTATIGGKVRQDDMLAMWPSAYPADTVLDIFTYAGAPGAYSLNLGSGGGLWWQSGGFSISANYVSANGNNGSPNIFEADCGGIGTDCSAQTGTAQIAYAGNTLGHRCRLHLHLQQRHLRSLWRQRNTPCRHGFPACRQHEFGGCERLLATGICQLVPWHQPGLGPQQHELRQFRCHRRFNQSQSWYVGIQWQDVFWQGNALGMAVGQPTFLTNSGDDDLLKADDGQYAWEWWYKFQVTDNISVTPALYYLSAPYGQLQNWRKQRRHLHQLRRPDQDHLQVLILHGSTPSLLTILSLARLYCSRAFLSVLFEPNGPQSLKVSSDTWAGDQ